MQRKLTKAGYLGAVLAAPYPPFPDKPLDRIQWAEKAPLGRTNAVSAQCVLSVLAHRANTAGKAWPSIETLATFTSQSPRSVQTALRRLEGQRWLISAQRDRKSSEYWPKAPQESVCTWCNARWADGTECCLKCGKDADLFQPVFATG